MRPGIVRTQVHVLLCTLTCVMYADPSAGMKSGPRFHQKRHQTQLCRRTLGDVDTDLTNTALAPAVLLARL